MKSIPIILALSILGLAGCRSTEQPEYNPKQEMAKIQQISDRFRKAYNNSNADSLAILFDEDVRYATNNGFLLKGREQVQETFSKWLKTPHKLESDTSNTWVADFGMNDDLAYSLTFYTQRLFPSEADTVIQKGYGLTVFERQEDGSWKIQAMTVNKHPDSQAPSN